MARATDIEFSGPELCALSACEAVDLLRKGEVAPKDFLAASRARVEAVEPDINAMPTRCWDRAEDALESLDGSLAEHPGWLGGLPIGIKDLTSVSGVRTTFGTYAMRDNVPESSDPLVLRLEERGAIVVGKTNTPEFGAGANTFNDVFGMTRNPWNTTLNAGGSSGGAAASLASGEVWLSQGSDLAGSLRTPAAFCGVVGFRPSPGVAGGGPNGFGFHTEGVSGPMARSVEDCALFLDAMAGFDPRSPISFPAPDMSYRETVTRADEKIRIAYSNDMNGFGLTSQAMERDLRDAMALIARNGSVVEEACPDLPELDLTYRTLRAILWAALPGRAPESVQQHYKQTLRENIEYGRNLTIDDVLDAQLNRSKLFDNVTSFLDDFDVLACPVVGLHPGPVEQEFPAELDGEPLTDYITWLRYSYLATATGLPAISVPVGFNDQGVPVGLQLIGRHRGEAQLLAAARAVEIAVGGPFGPIDPNVTHR
ncbi:amidase family protein [Shimia sp. SDUM112013]|uniref:amidase n=1 Tax=Shimia sp. SDUM112013 TaxID=3136160 RepID=UPI0032EEA68D